MELIDALDQTFQHAKGVIGNVRAEQMDNATPCSEWTVRDLMSHTIGVVAGIGATAADAPRSEFQLADDPVAQFHDAATANIAAWRAPGVMDKMVNGGPGPMPGHVLAGINLLDTATHTWDLAKATGQDAQLPADVATTALEVSRQIISPEMRTGRFGPEVAAPAGCGPTEQLVAFLGREP